MSIKRRIGRPKKYTAPEECIRVDSEKQKAEKRRITQFKKQLKAEGHLNHLCVIDILQKYRLPDCLLQKIIDKVNDFYNPGDSCLRTVKDLMENPDK